MMKNSRSSHLLASRSNPIGSTILCFPSNILFCRAQYKISWLPGIVRPKCQRSRLLVQYQLYHFGVVCIVENLRISGEILLNALGNYKVVEDQSWIACSCRLLAVAQCRCKQIKPSHSSQSRLLLCKNCYVGATPTNLIYM